MKDPLRKKGHPRRRLQRLGAQALVDCAFRSPAKYSNKPTTFPQNCSHSLSPFLTLLSRILVDSLSHTRIRAHSEVSHSLFHSLPSKPSAAAEEKTERELLRLKWKFESLSFFLSSEGVRVFVRLVFPLSHPRKVCRLLQTPETSSSSSGRQRRSSQRVAFEGRASHCHRRRRCRRRWRRTRSKRSNNGHKKSFFQRTRKKKVFIFLSLSLHETRPSKYFSLGLFLIPKIRRKSRKDNDVDERNRKMSKQRQRKFKSHP